MESKVIHIKEASKFSFEKDGKESVLEYVMVNENTINMIHTYVPPELRGHQIAASLVTSGLDYAEKNNLKVIPTCSYVRAFAMRNEKYKKLLA